MPILQWLNRDESIKEAARVPYRLLEAVPKLSVGDADTENMLIQGDNLHALKALLPYYAGKVKCIYIDPPYNTKSFQNEHYDDSIEFSVWLSKIYPRLEILYQLLSNDGFLFVQIDDNNFANLWLILSEMFGSKRMKSIAVKMSEPTGVKMASIKKTGSVPKLKEFIILAGKSGIKDLTPDYIPKGEWDNEYKTICLNASKEELARVKEVLENEDRTESDVEYVDNIGRKLDFQSISEYSKLNKLRINDEWLFKNSWRIVQFATLTGGARDLAVEYKLRKNLRNGAFSVVTAQKKLYLIKSAFNHETRLPRCKLLFADLYLEVHSGDFWSDIKTTGLDNEGAVDFKNGKKPERLIKRIIGMATNPNDLVLDSFLGSGTTAAVAHKMGRRYIGIEMGEHAKTHCAVRLNKVIEGEQGGISKTVEWEGGGGFRFYQLGEAIFDEEGQINPNIKFQHLAAHIWFSETRTPYTGKADSPLLGIHNGTAYYLLYNGILGDRRPHGGNVLTSKILASLPPHDGAKIIYGETSRLGQTRLDQHQITFKQTPYDIRAR